MTANDLVNYIGLVNTPKTWIKYFNDVDGTVLKYDKLLNYEKIKKALSFYEINEAEFKEKCLEYINRINRDDKLIEVFCLCYYIMFFSEDGDIKDCWGWQEDKNIFMQNGTYMLPLLVLLSGYDHHKANIKKRHLDEKQIRYQINGVRDAILKDKNVYKINGIRFSTMAWGSLFINLGIVQVGRLQYEIKKFNANYYGFLSKKDNKFVVMLGDDTEVRQDGLLNGMNDQYSDDCWVSTFNITDNIAIGNVIRTDATIEQKTTQLNLETWELILAKGTPCFGIHIPTGSPLDSQTVDSSLIEASKKLSIYYPEIKNNRLIFMCHSWLLSNNLDLFLDKTTNIIKFRDRFYHLQKVDNGDDFLQFVFNQLDKKVNYYDLKEETSLQKKMKNYLVKGGKLQEGFGVIIDDLDKKN